MRDTNTRADRGRGRGGRRGRNAGRPKRKTADQLDAEMVDYFDVNAANGNAGGDAGANTDGGAAANGGDDGMVEILVGDVMFLHVHSYTNRSLSERWNRSDGEWGMKQHYYMGRGRIHKIETRFSLACFIRLANLRLFLGLMGTWSQDSTIGFTGLVP